MKNYYPLQLFFLSSIIMEIVLIIRCSYSPLFIILIGNVVACLISLILVKKKLNLAIGLQKLFNVGLITSFFFQDSFTDGSILIFYIIADTEPILLLIGNNKHFFLNCQYTIIVYATVSVIVNQKINDQLFYAMVIVIYILCNATKQFFQISTKSESNNQIQQSQILSNKSITKIPLQVKYSNTQRQDLKDMSDLPSGKIESFLIENNNNFIRQRGSSIQLSSNRPSRLSANSIQCVGQSQDIIWKQRVRSIPVGIAIIDRNSKKITYKNHYLDQLMESSLQLELNDYPQQFMNQFKFKIIDQGIEYKKSNFTQYSSLRQSRNKIELDQNGRNALNLTSSSHPCNSRRKGFDSSRTIEQKGTHHPAKTYTLTSIINKLQDGYFDNFLSDQDHTLELYCKYQVSPNNLVHLNVKILYSPDQIEMTAIIQDFTRQNKLQRMEEQQEFQQKMINSFSHELRTPLNSATLFFKSALLDHKLDKTIREQYILPGISSLMRQSHLIDDIIDFSQINAELFQIKLSEFQLKDLIAEVTQLFKFEFNAKKIGMAFFVDSTLPTYIKTDYQRLLQILVNLLYNALKYSFYGYVQIKIQANENIIKFQIIDEGVGITLEKINQIERVLKNYHSSTQDWNGFGLILSQMLLRYIGPIKNSDLQLYSAGLGLGTTVAFNIINTVSDDYTRQQQYKKLPNRNIQSAPNLNQNYGLIITIKGQSESKQILNRQTSSITAIDEFMKTPDPETHLVSELNLIYKNQINRNKKTLKAKNEFNKCNCRTILSVDDEIFNQISLTCILHKMNYEIDTAYNGQQAIQKIEQKEKCSQQCRKYLFILMDCQMPILDGWQTTKILKQKFTAGQLMDIPIIGFTAFTSKSDLDQCRQAGMVEVLNKPLQVKKLKFIIEKLSLF